MDWNFWLGVLANISGVTAATFSVFSWIRLKALDRMSDDVSLQLRCIPEGGALPLPVPIKRRDCTRTEVLGILGMLPRRGDEQERFKIRFLSTPAFFERLNAVRDGRARVLEIDCTAEELEQFDRAQLTGA